MAWIKQPDRPGCRLYKADVCCLFFAAAIFYGNHQIILQGNFILFKIYYLTPFLPLNDNLIVGSKIDTKHLWQAYTCLTKKNYYSNDFLRKKRKYSKRHFFMYVSWKSLMQKKWHWCHGKSRFEYVFFTVSHQIKSFLIF